MVMISCDTCGTQRGSDNCEGWILGFDVPAASAPMKRSMRFFERWEQRRVLDPGAVHFCSVECKNTYVDNATAA